MDCPVVGITVSNGDGTEDSPLAGQPLLFLNLQYVQAVEEPGGRAIVLPLVRAPAAPAEVLDLLDGMLVTGSDPPLPRALREQPVLPGLKEQAPDRYRSDVAWIQGALDRRLPLLAICRGMQTLNEVLGGTLWPRLYPPAEMARHSQLAPGHQPWHQVCVEPGTLLARALGKQNVWTNSFHVQGVREPGQGLRISARAVDGVVEAVEGAGGPFLMGLQFHPERLLKTEPALAGIFAAFVQAAAAHRAQRLQQRARSASRRP